jgi:hypothetical protein
MTTPIPKTTSSHKRKRLKQEQTGLFVVESPLFLPIVSRTQVSADLTPDDVAERAPTTINGDGTNFEEVLHVPTALFGSTFANANGNRHSLAVRDNHMRAQLIDFGYERPSFKRVKVMRFSLPSRMRLFTMLIRLYRSDKHAAASS